MTPGDPAIHDAHATLLGDFTGPEITRYARHFVLPGFGPEAQRKCRDAAVLVVGAGGLGSPAIMYLAAAGIGRIGIADHDVVDVSNLQRQVIHGQNVIGSSKAGSAARRVKSINPHVAVVEHREMITSANALNILGGYDLVVDGTDNFPTRYLLNDACVLMKKPLVYGSVYRFEGRTALFDGSTGPCYRCLFPQPPPSMLAPDCAEAGVLGVLPGIIGTLQATAAIKCVAGLGELQSGHLVLFDALRMEMQSLRITKDPECAVCGDNPSIHELIDYEVFCDPDREKGKDMAIPEITVAELKARREKQEPFVLLDVRQEAEHQFVNIGGTILPLHQLAERINELDPSAETIVYCRSGSRSATAVRFLQNAGFSDVKNLKGGILAWATEIDPNLPTY